MAIGKTRHLVKEPSIRERFDVGLEENRGLLRWPPPVGQFRHVRLLPASDLAPWVELFWMVTWDLESPHLQETLPHPNFFFTFQRGQCEIRGVTTGKFSRVLEGRSGVFGIRFRYGGFRPFMSSPAVTLRNQIIPAGRVFGKGVAELEAVLNSLCWDEDRMAAALSSFLRKRLPAPDPAVELNVGLAEKLVEQVKHDKAIRSVNDLAHSAGLGVRAVQRIFREYVGASPKWVIRRFRLHEIVEILNSGKQPDWAQAALELGYFDQAHLINDFKAVVGESPTQYRR